MKGWDWVLVQIKHDYWLVSLKNTYLYIDVIKHVWQFKTDTLDTRVASSTFGYISHEAIDAIQKQSQTNHPSSNSAKV